MKYCLVAIILLFSVCSAFSQETLEYGVALYRAGNYEKASEVLKAVTTSDKKNKIAWAYLGASQLRDGNEKEAVKSFSKGKAGTENLVPGDGEPLKILKKIRVRYTDLARQNLTTGTIKLAVEFGADAKVGFVYAFQTLPNGLTENSIAATKAMEFSPAKKDGAEVKTVVIIEHTFDIH